MSKHSILSTSFHIMLCTIFFVLFFSVAIASPLLGGSDDWDTWFSFQSNAADAQTLPQLNSASFENDIPYLNDLSSYQIDSDYNMFGSADEMLWSEHGGPETSEENTGSWADTGPIIEALAPGPEPQAVADFENYAAEDRLAQIPSTPSPERVPGLVPTAENPCPNLETYCCKRIQYAPLLYVNKDHCKPCMTHANNSDSHIYFPSTTNNSHRRSGQRYQF